MSRTRGYKKVENSFVRKLTNFFKNLFISIGKGLHSFVKTGQKKLTIMIVPHSQKKVLNFQATVFSVSIFLIIIVGILGGFFWYSKSSITANSNLANLREEVQTSQANLDQMRDSVQNLMQAYAGFGSVVNNDLLKPLGLDNQTSKKTSSMGDFPLNITNSGSALGVMNEINNIEEVTNFFNDNQTSLKEIGRLLQSQAATFTDIPNLWPLAGGIGHFSMYFGRNKHPITGVTYLHKGLDISNFRSGDPILCTANGQVVLVEYNPAYGNTVVVKHKHGFYTRYAHLQAFRVQKGQYLEQGDIVGFVGNTGISTGPHLHYEVHIGSDVVDPMSYLNISMKSSKNK